MGGVCFKEVLDNHPVTQKWSGGFAQAVLGRVRETLTSNEEIVSWWKEHFEELLNSRDMPPSQTSEPEASALLDSISLVEKKK